MIAGWRLGLYFIFCISTSLAVALEEFFQEDLIIRPLRDGKVASTFSFTTELQGASPRNPETLGLEDDCELMRRL